MKGKSTSARMVLIKILCIFLIPFLLFIILLNVYCNTIYTQRLTQNNRTRLDMYESFIEEDLIHVQYFMSDLIANDGTFASIRHPLSEVNSYLQGQLLKEKFDSVMKSIDGITAFCVLSSESNFYSGTYARGITFVEKENIQSYLQTLVAEEEDQMISDWHIQEIGGEYFFIKVMGQGNTYCSCLIAANNLSRQQEDSYLLFENGGDFLSYADRMKELGVRVKTGKDSYRSGSRRNQFVVQEYFELLNANILLVEEYHGIWSFQSMPVIMVIISLFFAFLIIICYRLLKRGFLRPLEEMVETMEQIRDGETGSRLNIGSEVQEFQTMNIVFNSMMDRIQKLKLLAYDRLIQMQQTELQYYQIQIRPHFYLNCLKTLYGMASLGNHGQLKEMILTMSDYLRPG